MTDSYSVTLFNKWKSKVGKAGLFLDIFDNKFIIGKKRYARSFKKIIEKSDALCGDDNCPLVLLSSLDEVSGFVYGFCVASNKKIPI